MYVSMIYSLLAETLIITEATNVLMLTMRHETRYVHSTFDINGCERFGPTNLFKMARYRGTSGIFSYPLFIIPFIDGRQYSKSLLIQNVTRAKRCAVILK